MEDLQLSRNTNGTLSLNWSYRNIGDYNLDGKVDIQEISHLARHFFHASEAQGGTPTDSPIETLIILIYTFGP